ncbi:MAG: hypothetical protein J0M12_04230 [Deltaproteobacteria bacterium]|nr:hypothetical protein [Deltaproteobacteria bacterium]
MLSQLAQPEVSALLKRMESAAFAAAQHLLRSFSLGRMLEASRKADASIVTILDVESQGIIRRILGDDIAVIAEEDSSTHTHSGEKEYFLVDPLDGTSACKRFPGVEGGPVGYGPLIGYCRDHKLLAAAYVNVPTRKMYTAIRSQGAYEIPLLSWAASPCLSQRLRLRAQPRPLTESAAIFYPGLNGEIQALENLRRRLDLETTYRFGGFANDCVRLSTNCEQIGIQFSLKAWDLSAALIPAEAGLHVFTNPLSTAIALADFEVTAECAVLICQSEVSQVVLEAIR